MFSRPSLLILAPVLTLGLAACRPDPTPADRADAPTLAVQTAVVQSMPGPGTRALPATVRPVEVASLAAQVSGTVATHEAPLGRAVTVGTVLLTLQAPALEAGVAQARAALDLATAEHARETRLLTQGASTTETVRRLDDQRRIAAAALDQAQAQLAYTRVVAPFAGVVTARHVEPGDTVAPGRPLVALEGRDARRVEVAVPASWPDWPVGTAIDIQVEAAASPKGQKGGHFFRRVRALAMRGRQSPRSRALHHAPNSGGPGHSLTPGPEGWAPR